MNLQFSFGILTTIAFLYARMEFMSLHHDCEWKFFSVLFAFDSFDEIFSSISASNITFVMLIELYNITLYILTIQHCSLSSFYSILRDYLWTFTSIEWSWWWEMQAFWAFQMEIFESSSHNWQGKFMLIKESCIRFYV